MAYEPVSATWGCGRHIYPDSNCRHCLEKKELRAAQVAASDAKLAINMLAETYDISEVTDNG